MEIEVPADMLDTLGHVTGSIIYDGLKKEVTARWLSDNQGSWLTKNIRPLVLIFLCVSTVLLIFIDAGVIHFEVKASWVDLLQLVLITVIGAYFGGRSLEKVKK